MQKGRGIGGLWSVPVANSLEGRVSEDPIKGKRGKIDATRTSSIL